MNCVFTVCLCVLLSVIVFAWVFIVLVRDFCLSFSWSDIDMNFKCVYCSSIYAHAHGFESKCICACANLLIGCLIKKAQKCLNFLLGLKRL